MTFSADFNNDTIEAAISYLSFETKRLDPAHKGVTFNITPKALKAAKPITLTLTDVPLVLLLDSTIRLSNTSYIIAADADTIEITAPVAKPENHDFAQPDDEAGKATARKLQTMVIDKVNFDKLDVEKVLQFLADKSNALDPDKKGVNFVLGTSRKRTTCSAR